jgi:hypothetical protein
MSPAIGLPPATLASPLSDAHFALLARAAAYRRPLTRAARIAASSATFTLVIAATAVPFAVWSLSISGLLVAGALAAVGIIELTGGRRIRRADPGAPKLLALNQIAFLGLIVLYCLWKMVRFSAAAAKGALSSPELSSALGPDNPLDKDIEQLAPLVTYALYSLVIILSVGMQGGMALYYFTRARAVQAYRQSTPPWVQRLFDQLDP